MPHQLRTFTHGDLTLSYEVHGSGDRTLVYLHGLLLDAAVNRRLARTLPTRGTGSSFSTCPATGLRTSRGEPPPIGWTPTPDG